MPAKGPYVKVITQLHSQGATAQPGIRLTHICARHHSSRWPPCTPDVCVAFCGRVYGGEPLQYRDAARPGDCIVCEEMKP